MFAIVTSRNPTNVPSATTASTFHLRSTSGRLRELELELRLGRLGERVDQFLDLLLGDRQARDVLRSHAARPPGLFDETDSAKLQFHEATQCEAAHRCLRTRTRTRSARSPARSS